MHSCSNIQTQTRAQVQPHSSWQRNISTSLHTIQQNTTDHDPWHAGTTGSLAPFKLALFTKQTANLWNALKCKLKNFTRKKRKNCRGPKTDSSSTRRWSQYHQSECLRTAAPDRLHNLEKTHNFEKNALTQKQTEKQTTNKKDREDRKNYQHIAYKTLSVNTINLNVFINSLY